MKIKFARPNADAKIARTRSVLTTDKKQKQKIDVWSVSLHPKLLQMKPTIIMVIYSYNYIIIVLNFHANTNHLHKKTSFYLSAINISE